MPADRIYSISEITRDIRRAIESNFGEVWVEGEVSNLRIPTSGHHYFTLKDEGAQIQVVMFSMAVMRNGLQVKDGQKLQVGGNLTVYEERGNYQIMAHTLQLAGHGELQARYEALKRKLQAEGLFDPEKKKPIPTFPRTIGVVTSPTGAALQDICKVLSRRAPWIQLVVLPCKVQGEAAPGEISRVIQYISTKPSHLPQPDTIIVARGGGSIEDLWAFNDEAVARAIYDCPYPVISGVGHEIDFTIADFVADRREPTPSAAIEAAVPDGQVLHQRLDMLSQRLDTAAEGNLREQKRTIDALRREMEAREPARKLQNWAQAMDYLDERLESAVNRRLESHTATLSRYQAILAGWNPERDLLHARERIARARDAMEEAIQRRFQTLREQLHHQSELLKAIGPENTLQRGYSITLDEGGQPIFKAADLKPGQLLTTRLADGDVRSRVEA